MGSVRWFWLFCLLCFEVVISEDLREARIIAIEEALREQTLEISQLRKTVLSQNEEIADLKQSVIDLRRKQNGQKQQLSLLKSLIQRSIKREDVDESILTDSRTDDLSDQDDLMSVDLTIKRGSRLLNPLPTNIPGSPQPHIAFHAYLSHVEKSPGPHHTIIFNSVTIDLHNCYNVHNGMFTAPVPGVYAFFFTMRLGRDSAHSFELIKNSEVIEVIVVKSKDWVGQMSSGSNIVSLQTGDVIYVRTHETHSGSGDIFSDQLGRPHFSGYLLYSEQ